MHLRSSGPRAGRQNLLGMADRTDGLRARRQILPLFVPPNSPSGRAAAVAPTPLSGTQGARRARSGAPLTRTPTATRAAAPRRTRQTPTVAAGTPSRPAPATARGRPPCFALLRCTNLRAAKNGGAQERRPAMSARGDGGAGTGTGRCVILPCRAATGALPRRGFVPCPRSRSLPGSKWAVVRVAAAVAVQLSKKDLETLRKMPNPPASVQVRKHRCACPSQRARAFPRPLSLLPWPHALLTA